MPPTTTRQDTLAPISHHPGEGEALWFLGGLVTIKASSEATGGGVTVMEDLAGRASAPRCTSTTARTSGST